MTNNDNNDNNDISITVSAREKEGKRAKNCFFLSFFFLLFTRNIFTAFFTGNPVPHGLEEAKKKEEGGGSNVH